MIDDPIFTLELNEREAIVAMNMHLHLFDMLDDISQDIEELLDSEDVHLTPEEADALLKLRGKIWEVME